MTVEREAAQRSVESMVKRVGLSNGDNVTFYLESYNAEMEVQGVNDALRLEFFCLVMAP